MGTDLISSESLVKPRFLVDTKPTLLIPAGTVCECIIPNGLSPDMTVFRTISFFARNELSALLMSISTNGREFFEILRLEHPREIEDRIIDRISAEPKVIRGLEKYKKERDGFLARRFPVPGYDDVPSQFLKEEFRSAYATASIDEFNTAIASLNTLTVYEGYNIFVACTRLLENHTYERAMSWANSWTNRGLEQ